MRWWEWVGFSPQGHMRRSPRFSCCSRWRSKACLGLFPSAPINRVYVLEDEESVSWLDPRTVLAQIEAGKLDANTVAGSVAEPVTLTLNPDLTLCIALEGFLRENATVLPVTPGQWRNTLLGEVSRSDVLLAIQDRLTFPK